MGLLDDLKNQADNKRAENEAEAERQARREQFYREKILPRMVKAYQFLNEFIDHLNVLNHEVVVEYPILPQGKKQPFQQTGYKVVIDSSKALKQIDFTMECVLESPVEFELYGKEVVLNHADRVQQYSVKHERKDRKTPSMELQSAKFIIIGPLPLRISLKADVAAGDIKLQVRNFIDPGFQNYTLKVEQFNDEFLDRLGRFVLRQDMSLFGKQEMSEEQRKQLRERMQAEEKQRQQELVEAEERAKAEAEAEAANTTKEQLKRAMNSTMSQGKENLRGMFNKIKQTATQIAENKLKAPDKPQPQNAGAVNNQPTQASATGSQQAVRPSTQQRPAAAKAANPAQQTQAQQTQVQQNPAQQNRVQQKPAAPVARQATAKPAAQTNPPATNAKTPAPQVATQEQDKKASLQAKLASQLKATIQSNKKPGLAKTMPLPEAKKAAAPVKTSEPPRVYQAPSGNPFLTPEDNLTPEQIKEQAEKEKRLKEQTLVDRIAEKARANDQAKHASPPQAVAQQNAQANGQKHVEANQQTDKTVQTKLASDRAQPAQQKNALEPGSSLSLEPQTATQPAAQQRTVENKPPVQKPGEVAKQQTNRNPAKPEQKPATNAKQEKGSSLTLEEPAENKPASTQVETAKRQDTPQAIDKILQKGSGLSLEGETPVVAEQQAASNEPPAKPPVDEPVGLAPELDADGLPMPVAGDTLDIDLSDLSTLSDVEEEQTESPIDETQQVESSVEASMEEVKDDKPDTPAENAQLGSLKAAWQSSRQVSKPETDKVNHQEQESVGLAPEVEPVEAPNPVEESSVSELVLEGVMNEPHSQVESDLSDLAEIDSVEPESTAPSQTESNAEISLEIVEDTEVTAESIPGSESIASTDTVSEEKDSVTVESVTNIAQEETNLVEQEPETTPESENQSESVASTDATVEEQGAEPVESIAAVEEEVKPVAEKHETKPEPEARSESESGDVVAEESERQVAEATVEVKAETKPVENKLDIDSKAKSEPKPDASADTEINAPDTEAAQSTEVTEAKEQPAKVTANVKAAPVPHTASDSPALSLEDELERDLAKFIEQNQDGDVQPIINKSASPAEELKIDLSSPDELEIDFENDPRDKK